MEIIENLNDKYKIARIKTGPIATNCYIVSDLQKNAAIVDFAYYDNKIINYFSQENLNLNFILLTHGHFDHTMGIEKGVEALNNNCTIWINELDKTLAEDPNKNASCFFDFTVELKLKNLKTFSDGQLFFLNDDVTFKAMATPGHTAGSSSFLLNDEFLFTGDALFKNSVGRTDLFSGSELETQKTIQKFKQLNSNLKILPGHGQLTSLKEEFLNNPAFA